MGQEILKIDGKNDVPMDRGATTMAVAVIFNRITQLPEVDVQELFELAMELPKAKSSEEVEAIRLAMVEILHQEKSELRTQELGSRPEKLQKWVDYISKRVKEFREACGLSQVQLAEKSGLPQSHISRIENGRLSPSRASLEKIARAMGHELRSLDPTA